MHDSRVYKRFGMETAAVRIVVLYPMRSGSRVYNHYLIKNIYNLQVLCFCYGKLFAIAFKIPRVLFAEMRTQFSKIFMSAFCESSDENIPSKKFRFHYA